MCNVPTDADDEREALLSSSHPAQDTLRPPLGVTAVERARLVRAGFEVLSGNTRVFKSVRCDQAGFIPSDAMLVQTHPAWGPAPLCVECNLFSHGMPHAVDVSRLAPWQALRCCLRAVGAARPFDVEECVMHRVAGFCSPVGCGRSP